MAMGVRINGVADFVARWGTVFSLVSGGVAWLTKNTSWFGHFTWPEAILVGLASTLAAFFVASIALAVAGLGFRLIKPYQGARPTTPDNEASAPVYDDTEMRDRIGELSNAIAAVDQKVASLPTIERVETVVRGELNAYRRAQLAEVEPIKLWVEQYRNEQIDGFLEPARKALESYAASDTTSGGQERIWSREQQLKQIQNALKVVGRDCAEPLRAATEELEKTAGWSHMSDNDKALYRDNLDVKRRKLKHDMTAAVLGRLLKPGNRDSVEMLLGKEARMRR